MKVTPIHTQIVRAKSIDLYTFLDRSISTFTDRSILAVTSKVVALCEGNVRNKDDISKEELIEEESELFLPAAENTYGIMLTVKHNLLIPAAGIDESNADGQYVLWPQDPQKTANQIREYLIKRFSLSHVGVILTDSKTTPLRWGVTGVALAHSGFQALTDYRGSLDIFGRTLEVTCANIRDGLAASAVLVMGEGDEQTPIAVIEDVSFVSFQDRNPIEEELHALKIKLEEDVYSGILKRVPWQSGKKKA